MFTRTRRLGTAACVIALGWAGAAHADASTLFAGLSGDRTLTLIDLDRARVVRQVHIKGINGRVLGFDVRPADGQLWGVATSRQVFTIDPQSGKTTVKSRLSQAFPANVEASVDFNPAVDRLRMIGTNGTNWSVSVDDGVVTPQTALTFVQPNPFGGTGTPSVVAAAYINNVPGTKATLLFDIERLTKAIYLQLPPAAGILNPVAPISFDLDVLGFDIQTTKKGANRGFVANGGRIREIRFLSGTVSSSTRIAGLPTTVRDLAVLPDAKKTSAVYAAD
jgi:Domain of unknown function (DUF4394)